ncbi:MAG: hypothetical protein HY902_20615 [Deltaproteobacteria bacterium]|nr:hypothetical protein [Deltaproteobacteria bacterium]
MPRNVPKLGGVVSLASSAMGQFTCAVLADGTAQCWGLNSYGQLGDGTNTYRTAPTGVLALKGAASISTGYYHTCARLSDGTA